MTSLFLSTPCEGCQDKVLDVAWCQTESIAAVATEKNSISFYNDEGQLLPRCVILRECLPTCMHWQAKSRTIATGWEDGHISVYTLNNNKLDCIYANEKEHFAKKVNFLMWNPASSRLITGDSHGSVRVWKADSRGALSPYKLYNARSPTTTGVFSTAGYLSTRSDFLGNAFSPAFFFGTEDGKVFYADDLGHSTEVQSLASAVDFMLFYHDKSRLVIMTKSLVLSQLQVGDDGRVTPLMQMKVSVAGHDRAIQNLIWAGPGLIAAASTENLLRFWDLASGENYVLPLSSVRGLETSDRAISLAFNPNQRYLAAGTKEGKVALWRFVGMQTEEPSNSDWQAMPIATMKEDRPVHFVQWGAGKGLLASGTPEGGFILREDVLHRMMAGSVGAIQTSSDTVRVELSDGGDHYMVRCSIHIRGMALSETHLAVWSGSQAQTFQLTATEAKHVSTFDTSTRAMVFRDEYLYRASGSAVDKCNLHGRSVPGGKITFTEGEGYPILLSMSGRYLAIASSAGFIKLFDLDRREKDLSGPGGSKINANRPKQIGSSGKFIDPITSEPLGEIRSIAVNCNGSRVSLLSDTIESSMQLKDFDSRLHVYDADRDTVDSFDCGQDRYPVGHYWDSTENKLLAIETRRRTGSSRESGEEGKRGLSREEAKEESLLSPLNRSGAAQQQLEMMKSGKKTVAESEITTLFVTSEHGIQMQDSFTVEPPLEALIACHAPKLYFAAEDRHQERGVCLMSRVLHDFVGLEDVDEETKRALLDFSFNLTIKNMDEAHRAVKLIKKTSVWENMANMCVKTKRLDVAEVCLGNMGFARGAASVRLAKREPELEARVAAVAIQLGLLHDAEKLYRECGRYDLLNQLYQASGCWDRALDVAEDKDRIHLKTTHHEYARHLEELGDSRRAIHHYEYADTHRTEVPRMLFDRKRLEDLEDYITTSGDPELFKWWAGYNESIGQFEKAQHFYGRAEDRFSLVRLACFGRDISRAKQLVEESGDCAAAYYLARYLEAASEVQEALHYYALSKCYNHAIRLAKSFGMDGELMAYALKATPTLMIDCALYFESKGEFEKAVQLYQKGGDVAKSLDLCFKVGGEGRSSMFEVLKTIVSDLDEHTNPQTLARCAEFLIEHGQYEKAVDLFIRGKRYTRAIELCLQHRVKISEAMAEGLTPPAEEDGVEDRVDVLLALARACKKQGSFQLATKKYILAGERVKAMKCLLKSGDTKNIVYYATRSRSAEIYILAANYLQSLDWHEKPELMKNIVSFYNKAKAFEQLSAFFDAYAQMEIDEYRDYEKALNALRKAMDNLVKSKAADKERQMAHLDQRIAHIDQFVKARLAGKDDPSSMVRICHALLEQRDVEAAIRVGDCYALLIEFYYGQQNFEAAFKLIEDMRSRQIVLHPYLEKDMLEEVHRRVGAPLEREGADHDDDDDVAEELDEAIDEPVDDMESDNEYPLK